MHHGRLARCRAGQRVRRMLQCKRNSLREIPAASDFCGNLPFIKAVHIALAFPALAGCARLRFYLSHSVRHTLGDDDFTHGFVLRARILAVAVRDDFQPVIAREHTVFQLLALE